MDNTTVLDELSTFIFTSKYARYNEKLKRRETWDEAVDRLQKMHVNRFRKLDSKDVAQIEWAFSLLRDKRVVPSMRSLQFGGKAIESKHQRVYNCAVRHVDSTRACAEIFHSLLCGNGIGIGLSKFFLDRLPNLVNADDKTGTIITYVIEDTIEGWSDSIEALLNCYLKNTAYTGRKIVFDYSKIRKKGAPLKTGGGKAPGYKGLKNAHSKIKVLLDYVIEERGQTRMRSVDVYDILMHCSDAVLSGGVRRSACSVIFDKDDKDMMNSKTFFKVEKKHRFGYNEDTKKHIGDVVVNGKKYHVELDDRAYEFLQKHNKISWKPIEPQRARSNNSILLLRNQCTLEEFREIVNVTQEFGEPGFVFADHPWTLFNPCVVGTSLITTANGIAMVDDLIDKPFTALLNGESYASKKGFWNTGDKETVILTLTSGRKLELTSNHKVMTTNGWKEAGELTQEDEVVVNNHRGYVQRKNIDFGSQDYARGYLLGSFLADGNVNGESAEIKFWGEDTDVYRKDAYSLIKQSGWLNSRHRDSSGRTSVYECISSVQLYEFAKEKGCLDNKKHLSKKALSGSFSYVSGLLSGYFDADGTAVFNPKKGSSVRILSSQLENLENIQIGLNALGIYSVIYNERLPEGERLLPDGKGNEKNYYCQATHEICISCDNIQRFYELVTPRNKAKNDVISTIVSSYQRAPNKTTFTDQVLSVVATGKIQPVYDCTVETAHAFDANGMYVHNCFEIGFIPVTADGVCGVQMCNLSSINGAKIKTFEDFLDCTKAATIIGTLQASYTEFPYLNPASEKLTQEEALLGVSITGMMDSPDILLNPEMQRKCAQAAVEANKEWSKKLGINPAARITCIKPEGTSSLVLKCGSGIHPHHARNYIRRVQCNKTDNVYRFFKKHNPKLCEESVWSENKTDDVVSFPVSIGEKAVVKADLNAIKHLELIKSTQQNWVLTGLTDTNTKECNHNVSCTVIVKDTEWDDVTKYLFENRQYFAAVSLLGAYGDKDYEQAPMEKMETEAEMVRFKELQDAFKHVDYTKMIEVEDETAPQQEAVCAGGSCEVVRI